jgi:sucrose phosphorylase
LDVDRFMAAQAIMLSLRGVPGIYFHSLFGSRGWPEGVRQTGRSRAINRQKLRREAVERELADPGSLRSAVFGRYRQLLAARAASPAFHPHGAQHILDCGEAVFAVLRMWGDERVLCLHNVSAEPQTVAVDFAALGGRTAMDVIGGGVGNAVSLAPYQVRWLKPYV